MGSGESWPGGRAPLAAHVRLGVRVRQMCWARLAHRLLDKPEPAQDKPKPKGL